MPAVITLTLNPALDLHHYVPDPHLGALNRATRSHYSASGKGINVSKTLSRLGVASTAVMPLGGLFGYTTQSLIGRAAAFYTPEVVPIRGETRCNVKINDETSGALTEFNDASPALSPPELEACRKKLLSLAGAGDTVVLSGSLPDGVAPDFYAELIGELKPQGIRICLDTSGDALARGLEAGPDLVKPNRLEAETLLGRDITSYADAADAARSVRERGAGRVILSLGPKGALFLGDSALVARHPEIRPVSTNGCGDTLLGAYIHGLLEGWPESEMARYAVATATARALLDAPRFPDPKLVKPQLEATEVLSADDIDETL